MKKMLSVFALFVFLGVTNVNASDLSTVADKVEMTEECEKDCKKKCCMDKAKATNTATSATAATAEKSTATKADCAEKGGKEACCAHKGSAKASATAEATPVKSEPVAPMSEN